METFWLLIVNLKLMSYSVRENLDSKLFDTGIIRDKKHHYCLRVFYENTDAGEIVYHSDYLNFFERARTCLFNELKIDQLKSIEVEGLKFIVNDVYIKFSKPFKLNDIILIETRHKDAKNASITLNQSAWSLDEIGKKKYLNTSAEIKLVLIDKRFKVKKIKNYLQSSFFQN